MRRYRVLLCDDDEATHEVLGEYLDLLGYEVEHARDGHAALERFRRDPPDLMLLDIQMPGIDGMQVLAELSRAGTLDEVPVLLLTSLNRDYLKVKGLELGAEDYLTKPCSHAELVARVRAALRRSGRYRRNAGALTGRLADLGLAELLQTLELGRKRGRVALPELDGEVVVAEGLMLEARQGRATGDGALVRLLLLERGSFSVQFATADATAAAGVPVQHALMEALTVVDEIRARVAPLAPASALVRLHPAEGEPPPAADAGPRPLLELVAALDGDPRANAERLVQASRDGRVEVLG